MLKSETEIKPDYFSLDGVPLTEDEAKRAIMGRANFMGSILPGIFVGQRKKKKEKMLQEDRITCGAMPQSYFSLPTPMRHRFIEDSCVALQKKLSEESRYMHDRGATLLFAFVNGLSVDIGYLGDSLAFLVIYENNKPVKCELLNPYFHQVKNEKEKQRIAEAQGTIKVVDFVERLEGYLLLSRALGNNRFNEPNESKKVLSREAMCSTHEISLAENQTATLLLASDGLVHILTNHFNEYVLQLLQKYNDIPMPHRIAKIIQHVAEVDNSSDDISIIHCELQPAASPVFLALFDGHGGHQVAELARLRVADVFTQMVELYADLAQNEVKGSTSSPPSQSRDNTQPYEDVVTPTSSETAQLPKLKRSNAFFQAFSQTTATPDRDEDSNDKEECGSTSKRPRRGT